MTYFNNHNHTCYSNLRLVDSISQPKDLINRAVELGLSGIAITDHESLGSHVEVNLFAKELRKTNPNFTVALGNEIYLTDTRDKGQRYYHFILIAKDEIGYRGIKEFSSIAWLNGYFDRGMERVPLLKSELAERMSLYKGHIIATTACIGGELGQLILANREDPDKIFDAYDFVDWCIDIFGKDDFYIEVPPSANPEQLYVNKRLKKIADRSGLKMCVATDSHYLSKEDRYVHKAYLNSKNGEREVDAFYEYARLMTVDETTELLSLVFDQETIESIYKNSESMRKSIQWFSLEKHPSVPEVEVSNYSKVNREDLNDYPTLKDLFKSDNAQEKYWVNECFKGFDREHIDWKTDTVYINELEEEARVKRVLGDKLQTCMFAYPNTLKHYIDLFWECGSTVGAGRGSSCAALNHYLLGVTQLDPVKEDLLFFWRYLNTDRVELGDIDIDLCPSKIQDIFAAIRKERGELGLVQVCTYGTEGTRSAILTACRGYRSDDYPNGIDSDEAQYMSSLVPSERGFSWTLSDMINGNPEKGRKPIKEFISTVNNYPGLLDIMTRIEGLVNRRGIHASGVIFYNNDTIFDEMPVMRAPNGAITTQWDLHMAEKTGAVKFDFLLTNVQDIILKTIQLLQKDNVIEPDLTIRQAYNKYLHPSVLPVDDPKIWSALENGEVLGCFQFDSPVGAQAAKKVKPKTPMDMVNCNGVLRLMPQEKGAEAPLDKYVRFKSNISLWYKEMENNGLTREEEKVLEPHFLPSYGVPISQECLMQMLQDPNICGFTLAEANSARKIVGKKLMNKIPELRDKVYKQAKSEALGKYVWKYGLSPQMGYSFSIIHSKVYSYIGIQTLYLATHFNPIYWNTAYLIVNSGSLAEEAGDQTDYVKVAKALGEILSANIKVSLVDINKSEFSFVPDVKNNQILFGLKGLANVNDALIKYIVANRPYTSWQEFFEKIHPNRRAMVSLIKGGAFDQFKAREEVMREYIWETCDRKSRITLQNMRGLIRNNLIPQDRFDLQEAKKIFEFNRYLKAACTDSKDNPKYILDSRSIDFLYSIDCDNLIQNEDKLDKKTWDKVYKKRMDVFRDWMKENQEDILNQVNQIAFSADWDKYASGNISAWEMEVLCFYYHDHEMKNTNMYKYGLVDFFSLPEEPIVDYVFKKGQSQIPVYKLFKICGTCIAKDKIRNTVSVLTISGVVRVKFRQEYFALFDKRIIEYDESRTSKRVVEKSWFNRGSMIMIQGFRRGDEFVSKKYARSGGHQLYHIDKVLENGDLVIRSTRKQGEGVEEDNGED